MPLNICIKENVFITIMLLKCFKLFYIKDNSVGNSVDFIKKKMDPPLRLLL